tara:strand:+ start:2415 stop:2663 length:249 start_codon:yes stop_codon:yes gene_type:complete
MKNLEKSEHDYIKGLFDENAKNYMSIGQDQENIKILEARINNTINKNLENKKDLDKYLKNLETKYGKININMQDGSYEEIEE